MEYCRHYFLIGGIILGLVILLIYHLTLGNKKPVFQCVAVNQEIDLNRDSKVSADFADYLGVKADKLGLRKPEDEKLLLCIPSDAKHPEEGKKFIEYISEKDKRTAAIQQEYPTDLRIIPAYSSCFLFCREWFYSAAAR